MKRNTITIKGTRYVLVPESQWKRLYGRSARLPAADRRGRRPARQTIQAMIAQDVHRARTAAGMTQEELAKVAGVRAETISRIEHAKQVPGVRTLNKLSRALGVPL